MLQLPCLRAPVHRAQRVIALENKFENEYREKITTLEKV
jgi:hypothetical protein